MARSYKKQPVVKDRTIGMKTIANRKIRRMLKCGYPVANGNAYRKLVCSYDICDWLFRETWAEYQARMEMYRKEYENGVCRFGALKDFRERMSYWDWWKMYKRK